MKKNACASRDKEDTRTIMTFKSAEARPIVNSPWNLCRSLLLAFLIEDTEDNASISEKSKKKKGNHPSFPSTSYRSFHSGVRFSQIRTNIKLSRPQTEIYTAVIQSLCRCETNEHVGSRARKKVCRRTVDKESSHPISVAKPTWLSEFPYSSSRFRYPQIYLRHFRRRSGAWVSL